MKRYFEVGDVVKSALFTNNCLRVFDYETYTVTNKLKIELDSCLTKTIEIPETKPGGWKRNVTKTFSLRPLEDLFDAEFVVIDVEYYKSHSGSGGMDGGSPSGLNVIFKKLDADGKWNANGVEVSYHWDQWYSKGIQPELFTIIRKMEQGFA